MRLLGEVIVDGRIARADGDNHLVAQHDAQRDCAVHIARALGINIRNIHDNQRLLLIRVVVNAGGFLFVQRGRQECRVKVEAGGQTIHFLLRRALQMHPYALFQRRAFGQMILDGLEDSSHVSAASFQHFRRKAARSASVSRQSAADGLRGTIRITVHAVRHSFPAFAGCLPESHAFYLTPISAIVNGVCRKKSENGASYLLSASPVPSGNRINGTQMLSQMLFLCCFRRKF